MLKLSRVCGLVTALVFWYLFVGLTTVSARQVMMDHIYGHVHPPAHLAAEVPKAMHISHVLHRELHHSRPIVRATHALDQNINDTCTPGNRTSFFVRDLFNQTEWNTIEATCIKIVENQFAVWVETRYEADISVRTALTEVWHQLTEQRTQNGLFSNQSPISMLTTYFGSFPNSRGDDLVDILFLDIADEFEVTGTYVAGFYDPINNVEHSHSNRRDMIYVDLFPGLLHQNTTRAETAASTIIHELQHLIFSQHDHVDQDNLFLNEGLSEMAEIMAGFEPRNSQYYFQNPNRPLFSWDFTNPMPDYSRGALFFTYLFEQIGFHHIRPMVQEPTPQQQRVMDYVTRHTRFHFDDLFKDWGVALLKNNVEENERWGYKTASLQAMRARTNIHVQEISILGAPSSPLSHTFHYFDLIDEVQLKLGNRHLSAAGYVQWPDRTSTQPTFNPFDRPFEAGHRPHGSRYVVLSNPSKTDLSLPESVIAIGEKSGISNNLAYDNGIPQVFINRASYLLLHERMSEIAVVFYPEENSWLKDILIMGVFLSEVQNSGIPQNAERSLEIQIHAYEDEGLLGRPLTPLYTWSFRRDYGDLGFERISLAPFYEELSQLTEPFAVRFSNASASGNPFAVGLSNSAPVSKSWYSASDNDDWEPLRFSSDHSTLSTVWNAMVRSTMVTQALPASHVAVNPVMEYDYSRLYVQLSPPTHTELNEITVAASLPDGSVRYGRFENERSTMMSPVFSFPLMPGPKYSFYYTQAETGSAQRFRSSWSWELPFEHSVQLFPNYPNPFNSETTLPFVVLANSEVQISVYNLLGQLIQRYPSRIYTAGQHAVKLDMAGLATGIYLVNWSVRVLSVDQMLIQTQKVTFVK